MAYLSLDTTRYLLKNKIKNEDNVKFQEEGHFYWFRSSFYDDWVSTTNGLGGLPIKSASSILDKYFVYGGGNAALKIWNKPEERHKMKYDTTSKYYGCESLEDVDNIMKAPMYAGTKMHAHYEDLCNLLEYDKAHDSPTLMQHLYCAEKLEGYQEKTYFYDFVKMFKIDDVNSGLSFYRTELMLYDEVLHLTGTIDALLYNSIDDSYVIVDWKRCGGGLKCDPNPNNPNTKPVYKLSDSGRGAGLEVFKNMRNNSMNRYGSQLTYYKNLFERMTGKRVSALYLVVVDSKKIGQKSAMKVHAIPIDKYQEGIRQAFEERALEMLGMCHDRLDEDHEDLLLDIRDEGEEIRKINTENANRALAEWLDDDIQNQMYEDNANGTGEYNGCKTYSDLCALRKVPPHMILQLPEVNPAPKKKVKLDI